MAVQPYLNFNGNCRQAVEFYQQVFETEDPRIMTYGQAHQDPEHALSEEAKQLVMHTELHIEGTRVLFSDVYPGHPYSLGNNVSLAVVSTNGDRLKKLYHRLAEGGAVHMELQETFWSKCYANLTDKFGIGWQLSQEQE